MRGFTEAQPAQVWRKFSASAFFPAQDQLQTGILRKASLDQRPYGSQSLHFGFSFVMMGHFDRSSFRKAVARACEDSDPFYYIGVSHLFG